MPRNTPGADAIQSCIIFTKGCTPYEIDRRLAEWRDKEIANRIRILKITLWASVIVAVVSLVYSYIKVYIVP